MRFWNGPGFQWNSAHRDKYFVTLPMSPMSSLVALLEGSAVAVQSNLCQPFHWETRTPSGSVRPACALTGSLEWKPTLFEEFPEGALSLTQSSFGCNWCIFALLFETYAFWLWKSWQVNDELIATSLEKPVLHYSELLILDKKPKVRLPERKP